MMKKAMIDLETMSSDTRHPLIGSIGIVLFDESRILKSDSVYPYIQEQLDGGAQLSYETILWWMNEINVGNADPYDWNVKSRVSCYQACQMIISLIDGVEEFWCNGNAFDFPILDNFFRRHGLANPIVPWQQRDFQTLKNETPKHRKLYEEAKNQYVAGKHTAVGDSNFQANAVIHILKGLS